MANVALKGKHKYSVLCFKKKIKSICHKSQLYSSLTFPLEVIFLFYIFI